MGALALEPETDRPAHRPVAPEPAKAGPLLALWVAMTVSLLGALWVAGFRTAALAGAVDQGAARVESIGVGEVADEAIRKAIHVQHETRPFWTVVAFLGDFLGEPSALVARALVAATAFSAVAALTGRAVGFDRALAACAAAQGFWVLGLAVRAGLMIATRSGDVETSAALFLTPGRHPAALALGLEQVDPFVLMGWWVVASGAVRRGQIGWAGALGVSAAIAATEAAARVGIGLLLGAGMRLTVMPA
jgi:hypothetical protein